MPVRRVLRASAQRPGAEDQAAALAAGEQQLFALRVQKRVLPVFEARARPLHVRLRAQLAGLQAALF